MPGWLERVAVAVLLLALPMPVGGQPPDPHALALAEALATYRGGELRGALQRLGRIPQEELNRTVFRFCTRGDIPSQLRLVRLRIATALLTEMGIERTRHQDVAWYDPYFAAARGVERRLSQMVEEGHDGAGEAERRFARDWYLLVVSFRHARSQVGWSRAYLAEARELFPNDPKVLLVSGSDHEVVSHVSAGYLRRFNANGQSAPETRINPEKELEEAEKYFKQAVALAPDLVEARLRLGRVLMRRGDLDGATRELRAALERTARDQAGYDQVRYLAWMFLGLVDVDRGNLESAEKSYLEALRLFPRAGGDQGRDERAGIPEGTRRGCGCPGRVADGVVRARGSVVDVPAWRRVALRGAAGRHAGGSVAMRLAATTALIAVLHLTAGAQEPTRFRAGTELVSIDVLVTDNRQPVLGLTPADFDVIDNGVAQAVAQLYLEQLPVNVVMVLDTSGSVLGARLADLKAGALSVIDKLRPKDRAAILSFSHRLEMPSPLTADRAVLRKAVNDLDAVGSTSLRDAAFAGLALRGADNTRTLLLLFSDGLDTASILSESRLMAVVRRSDAIIYAIGVQDLPAPRLAGRGPFFVPPEAVTDHRFLAALAREGGGRLLHAQQPRDIERTFARVLEEFNQRYVLGYTPRGVAQGGWHKVDVRLRNKRGTILARRGYLGS